MLIAHLASGFLIALGSAVWGLAEGYPLWAVLGLYSLGGNIGIMGSAAMELMRRP